MEDLSNSMQQDSLPEEPAAEENTDAAVTEDTADSPETADSSLSAENPDHTEEDGVSAEQTEETVDTRQIQQAGAKLHHGRGRAAR